jgi:glycosidase
MPPTVTITIEAAQVSIAFAGEGMSAANRAVFVGMKEGKTGGCAIVPHRQHSEGSTTFLPFPVDRIYAARIGPDGQMEAWRREWVNAEWTPPLPADDRVRVETQPNVLRLVFSVSAEERRRWVQSIESLLDPATKPGFIVWTKDLAPNDGWGAFLSIDAFDPTPIIGDHAIPRLGADLVSDSNSAVYRLRRLDPAAPRPRIYQLLPRLFTNTNECRKRNGTIAENGVGKFAEITDSVLAKLRDELAITHLWLTGIFSQATSTAYPDLGKPADEPALLKGLAGSPYAIKDYGDVCPDYAVDPARRLEEFKALVHRVHHAGLRVLIDFVPNHVARSHRSALVEFGRLDDPATFFSPQNNFYWLQPDSPGGGPPLKLPTVGDNRVGFKAEQLHGRVTGNNAATWSPSPYDWYETVKLNYGYDFTTGNRAYPHANRPGLAIPDTWKKMDSVLAYWQGVGVDGFRCDMAHMVPPEFWQWAVARARDRQPEVMFLAEAYNNDPMKVEGGDPLVGGFQNVSVELLNAGFDAVYDDPTYKALKRIYDGPGWANDLDEAIGVRDGAIRSGYIFHRALRYGENHDEVRLASHGNWAGLGMEVGRPVCAILFALSRGPILLYSGQEVGEPACDAEGYSGDDGRTTIFDYWSMPEMAKWVNQHRFDGAQLSPAQRDLRAYYGRLLGLLGEPAFRDGEFIPLNPHNVHNPAFGRLPGEAASGHWLYAFVRHDPRSGQAFLIVANLHPTHTFTDVRVHLTPHASAALWGRLTPKSLTLSDRLSGLGAGPSAEPNSIQFPLFPPLTTGYFSP